MKFIRTIAVAFAASKVASAHYIFTALLTGSPNAPTVLPDPVRWTTNYNPLKDVTSTDLRCNMLPRGFSNVTTNIEAGSSVGFGIAVVDDRVHQFPKMWHPGPAAFYLGRVPAGQRASTWDGSGENWFKIDEVAAKSQFHEFSSWPTWDKSQVFTTIPPNTPSGEYLLRVEHIGLHVMGAPEYYVACAQIKVVNGGTGNPTNLVSIPGYVKATDPGLYNVDLYSGNLASYRVPGPSVWRG